MLREWRSRNRSQWFRFCPRWNTRVLASSICDGACTSITTLLFHDCKLCWWWYYDDDNVDVDNNYVDGIMHDDDYVGCQLGICPVVVTFGAMPKSKVVFFSWKTKTKIATGTVQFSIHFLCVQDMTYYATFCQAALHIPVDVELAQLIYPQINCIIRKHPLIMVYNEH